MLIAGVVATLSGCGPSHRYTYRIDTNENEFRLFPLDVKKPTLDEAPIDSEPEVVGGDAENVETGTVTDKSGVSTP